MEKLKNFSNPLESNSLQFNEFLGYELESKDQISLHLLHGSNGKNFGEKLTLWKDGFKTLTRLLLGMDELKNVKYITATSWLVTDKPRLIKRLGFTIVDGPSKTVNKYKEKYKERISKLGDDIREFYHPDIEPGYAYISRDRFIELYADK